MAFNSIAFAIFLPIVFGIYWLLHSHIRWQNLFVLSASYVFYGWWDWRFLILIAFTSFCSWASGLLISRAATHYTSKAWMITNIVINLSILAIFKYYDFFITEFGKLFSIHTDSLLLRVILPVGISFYTFQALSYSIDVYRKKIEPTKDIIAFFAFIAFFPQLVAGPIERATNLLPQFQEQRHFDYNVAAEGLRRILWGLFKKIVIADTCATFVNPVWLDYMNQPTSMLVLAVVLFSFQICGDFSGYSDIAIGTARLFGITLRENFLYPYLSRDVAEFWKRWHISLNTWFVDYVYIPLGGSRNGLTDTIANTCTIFLLSGLWHGANWTFIAWGMYHALIFSILLLCNKTHRYKQDATWQQIPHILLTFILVSIGWIFFRAPDIISCWEFIGALFNSPSWIIPKGVNITRLIGLLFTIVITLGLEWRGRAKTIAPIPHYKVFYYILIFAIWWFSGRASSDFIYFQF